MRMQGVRTCIHMHTHKHAQQLYNWRSKCVDCSFAVIEMVVVYAVDIGEENSNPQLKLLSIIYEL